MKRLTTLILATVMSLTSFPATSQSGTTDAIREAVSRQMQTYPRSTLRDLYKNFFQDNFGPGHLLADPAAAERYLRSELTDTTRSRCPLYEPTGYRSNYYRVELRVIAENKISFDRFFDAFTRSMADVAPVDIEMWKNQWKVIIGVIDSMNLKLPGYETDRAEIDSLLKRGDYVVHHSKIFESTYNPHYRIIAAPIFLKELSPKIDRQ